MSVPMPPSTTAPPLPPSQAPPTPVHHHHHQQQQQQPPIVQKLAAVNEQAWLTLGAYTLNLLFFLHLDGMCSVGVECEKKKAEREDQWGEKIGGVCHIVLEGS